MSQVALMGLEGGESGRGEWLLLVAAVVRREARVPKKQLRRSCLALYRDWRVRSGWMAGRFCRLLGGRPSS